MLSDFAETLVGSIRRADLAARYGGEEFIVVMSNTAAVDARRVAEKIRAAAEAMQVPIDGGRNSVSVSVSVGGAAYPEDTTTAAELLATADAALYDAKHAGRNRVLHGRREDAMEAPSNVTASSVPVDLRSDTFTTPDAEMRAVMARAEVGDDVWGEDPTVHRLEEEMAARLGKEAAVFVPSGTMGNLSSLAPRRGRATRSSSTRQSHVVLNEAGGAGAVAGVMLRDRRRRRWRAHPAQVRGGAARARHPSPRAAAALAGEHPRGARRPGRGRRDGDGRGRGGGAPCRAARALRRRPPVQRGGGPGRRRRRAGGADCDTVSVCLSKGLGAPVGSVVSGDAGCIAEVRLWRKRLGGGMRQAGILAAAGLHALHNNVDRLADDHANAALLVARAARRPGRDRRRGPRCPPTW